MVPYEIQPRPEILFWRRPCVDLIASDPFTLHYITSSHSSAFLSKKIGAGAQK